MGRLIVGKNVEAILRAARLLQEQGLAFEVWIAGEGPDEGRLRQIAAELDLDETVRFVGPIPHPSTGFVYDACDVFVQPSHADLVSVAVLEAMRFGKALICSARVGAVGLVAHDGMNALIFDPAKPSQLADRMRQFIVDPQLAVKMGSRSESIMENHTKSSVAVEFIDVLNRISPAEA